MGNIFKDLEFEKLWGDVPETEKLKFVALQAYKASRIAEGHEIRIAQIERSLANRRYLTGGISGGLSGLFMLLVYFIGKFLKFWD